MANPFDKDDYSTTTPECIVKGRHIGWRLTYEYDDSEFDLKYVLSPVGDTDDANKIDVVGMLVNLSTGNYWVFEIPSSVSNAWTFTADTEYRWDLILTQISDSNEAAIRTGFVRLFITNSDRRTHAEIMLGKINSIIEGRADDDVSSYSIKSRSISKMGIDELMKWRDYYVNEVRSAGGSMDSGIKRPKRNTLQVGFK